MGQTIIRNVEELSKKLGESKFLLERRLSALRKLEKVQSATFRYGLGIVTNFDIDFNSLKLFNHAKFEISSNGKATAANFSEADAQQAQSIRENLSTTFGTDNKLLAMNAAFLNSGALISLPKGSDCGVIRLKLKPAGADFSHILIVAEEGSKATIIEELSGDKAEYRSGVVEIIAKGNSEIRFGAVQKLPGCKHFSYKKAVIGINASVEWLDISAGSSLSKTETYSELQGDGSKTSVFSVFFGNASQQYDFYSKCTHIGRNTESEMCTSGALKDKSKAVQQGFAKIAANAYNASARQKSKILLLSEDARAVPTPKLEIDNNDVAATHEAAVGQIDAEKIFYLMSRGLSEKEAQKLYVEGFFEQYTSKIEVEEVKRGIEAIIAKRMAE